MAERQRLFIPLAQDLQNGSECWIPILTPMTMFILPRQRVVRSKQLLYLVTSSVSFLPTLFNNIPERTPSTSPPPQPPTEEFMRPGLSADDIYIMVEDEFHAVAQTFTKHLHHAEYIRQKKAAKERNASTISNISRPVDSVTTMREETRKKKEVEAREGKMKAAIESIKAPKRAQDPLDESNSSDFEDDKQDDPWQGTQLQRFMTTSSKKNLPGLTGLQGVTSHTRAAAGYSKSEKRPPQPTRLFESTHPTAAVSKNTTAVQATLDSSSDTDDDDLDVPSRIPPRPPPKIFSRPRESASQIIPSPAMTKTAAPRFPAAQRPTPHPAKPVQRPPIDTMPCTSPASTISVPNPSKTQVSPDTPPIVRSEPLQESRPSLSEVRQRLKARREREEKENKARGGIADDEIPVFLVQ